MTTVALIPARGGSKGIHRKNLRRLCGFPLIAWSIGQALAVEGIDTVVVSTDDREIAATAIEFGALVPFLRPTHLAGDKATTESVMLHAVDTLMGNGHLIDRVILLQPTSPIRRPDSIASALAEFERTKADSLVSLSEQHPFVWTPGTFFKPQYDPQIRLRRQDMSDDQRLYVENGSIYVSSVESLLGSRCRVSGKVAGFPMTREESVDIDTEIDFTMAEAIIKYLGLTV